MPILIKLKLKYGLFPWKFLQEKIAKTYFGIIYIGLFANLSMIILVVITCNLFSTLQFNLLQSKLIIQV